MPDFAAIARRQVAAAYRPAFKGVNRQERRVKALNRKQARDEAAYQSWLKDTNASLNAEAAQRDSQLQGVEAGYHQQIQSAMGAAFGDAAARGAQIGGGAQQTTATDGSLARAGAAFGTAESAAYGGRLAVSQRHGLDLSVSTEKNTYAHVAQLRAQRRAATFDALSKLADQRGDLRMKRAADTAKAQSDLEAQAAKEAQQRFSNSLALQRLQQGQQRIDLSGEIAADRSALSHESSRQGRVRNQLARRRLAAAGKPGAPTPLSPSERRQRATTAAQNSSKIQAALNAANSYHTGSRPNDKVPPKPKHGPQYATRLANWLMSATDIGNQTLANVAAYRAANPGKGLPRWLARDLRRLNGQV